MGLHNNDKPTCAWASKETCQACDMYRDCGMKEEAMLDLEPKSKEISKGETKVKMAMVLNNYVRLGVIGLACDQAGISRKQHQLWMDEYPAYKDMFETMRERFVDGLELTAIERAKEKSDSLLILLLKSHRKEVYGDSAKLDINSTMAAPITLMFAEGMLNENERKLLEAGVDKEDKDGEA